MTSNTYKSLFLYLIILIGVFVTVLSSNAQTPSFASGIKIGEVTDQSAIVWVRSTQNERANFGLLKIFTEGLAANKKSKLDMPTDVVPGANAELRIRYRYDDNERASDWVKVDESTDFSHQFMLSELKPNRRYEIVVEARNPHVASDVRTLEGTFKTAPLAEDAVPIEFIVSTCQAIRSIDSGENGHVAYQQMLRLKPDFFIHTGDLLYYDKVPFCKNVEQARAKWNLMFAYGHNLDFFRSVSSYFMKDDHDTLKNDCWPGQRYGDLSFSQGLKIFREQVCMGEKTYRTFRWGKDVQVWLTENRDFRSANNIKDGPEKTILGREQKDWLKSTISQSDATFKFVVTPGPIVGPDKKGKSDNHSNAAFATEGQELRDFLSAQKNTFVICGDRHWQYSSVDPKTGLKEFGCGPINDEHYFGGNPGKDETMHRYFSPKGGFFRVRVDGSNAHVEWFHAGETDPSTGLPVLLYSETLSAEPNK